MEAVQSLLYYPAVLQVCKGNRGIMLRIVQACKLMAIFEADGSDTFHSQITPLSLIFCLDCLKNSSMLDGPLGFRLADAEDWFYAIAVARSDLVFLYLLLSKLSTQHP